MGNETTVAGSRGSGTPRTIRWNEEWRFRLEDAAWQGTGETVRADFDDSSWRTLALPHDWSVEGAFEPSLTSATAYLPGGVGWYRKRFVLPADARKEGSRVSVRFDGIYNHAIVWCNGRRIAERPYGYSTFSCDLTDSLLPGEEPQLLVVQVDHSAFSDSRWYPGSGITRDVWLSVTGAVHLAENGVFVQTPRVSLEEAEIRVDTSVCNASEQQVSVLLTSRILDARGVEVAAAVARRPVEARGEARFAQTVRLERPMLWSPEAPTLYRVETVLAEDPGLAGETSLARSNAAMTGGNGTPVEWINGIPVTGTGAAALSLRALTDHPSTLRLDRMETVFGVRFFSFHPNRGFTLNGVHRKLKGVCLHHDAGCFGAAVPKKVWARRLRLLKESGCNAIRFSHNPPDPALLDLCDEMGFLAMDEAFDEWEDSKNKWVHGHNQGEPSRQGYAPHFADWAEADLRAMVLRDRNHPSIILWSIGNEIDYPNDPWTHEVLGERFRTDRPHASRLGVMAGKLAAIVRSLDTTRPVTAALADVTISNLTGFADALDVAGYNYLERHYAEDHANHPERVIYGSENSQSGEAWRAVRDNDFICGQFLWTGIDFLGEARGWPVRNSQAGYLDTAGFKKPGFLFRKALWTHAPIAGITVLPPGLPGEMRRWRGWAAVHSWNWPGWEGQSVSVLVHTNCPEAELYLDDVSLGRKGNPDVTALPLEWEVPYRAGELRVIGFREGVPVCVDVLKTAGEAAVLTASVEDAFLAGDGRDLTHIELVVCDAEGVPVPDAAKAVQVACEGPVRLIGLENGDPASLERYGGITRNTHQGKLLAVVQSTGGTGIAVVHGTAEGLAPVSVRIPCV